MIYLVILAAAALIMFWPDIQAAFSKESPAKPLASISYKSAIDSLANVRNRLIKSDCLDDKSKAAIDTITLSLVAGSDKE